MNEGPHQNLTVYSYIKMGYPQIPYFYMLHYLGNNENPHHTL